jgi:nitroreductase
MEFDEVIKNRHSIRNFKDKKIPNNVIKKLLETVRTTPSAGNLQSYHIVLIKDEEQKKKLRKACLNQAPVTRASVVLVFFADYNKSKSIYGIRGEKLYSIQDATIACSYAQLAAVNLGLSSVWIGAFKEEEVRKACNARGLKPIAVLPIGYKKGLHLQTPRRKISDFVHIEKF